MISNKDDAKVTVICSVIGVLCLSVTCLCFGMSVVYYSGNRFLNYDVDLRFVLREPTEFEQELLAAAQVLGEEIDSVKNVINLVELESRVVIGVVDSTAAISADSDSIVAAPLPAADTAVRRPPVSISRVVADTGIIAIRNAVRVGDYGRAVDLMSKMRTTDEITYLRAQAIMGLFMEGRRNGSEVIAAWMRVKSMSVAGSERYVEADLVLEQFGK